MAAKSCTIFPVAGAANELATSSDCHMGWCDVRQHRRPRDIEPLCPAKSSIFGPVARTTRQFSKKDINDRVLSKSCHRRWFWQAQDKQKCHTQDLLAFLNLLQHHHPLCFRGTSCAKMLSPNSTQSRMDQEGNIGINSLLAYVSALARPTAIWLQFAFPTKHGATWPDGRVNRDMDHAPAKHYSSTSPQAKTDQSSSLLARQLSVSMRCDFSTTVGSAHTYTALSVSVNAVPPASYRNSCSPPASVIMAPDLNCQLLCKTQNNWSNLLRHQQVFLSIKLHDCELFYSWVH